MRIDLARPEGYPGNVAQGIIRFTPARTYLTAAAVALGLAVFSGWCAVSWLPAAIPAALFLASAGLVLWLGLRPAVEITDAHIQVGKRSVEWDDIRRIDQTGWISPMVADLTLADHQRLRIIYPGETQNSNRLLRLIQQRATRALINGVPHRQIFGDAPRTPAREALESPRYHLLTEEDEAEVERLYQRLKTVRRLDPDDPRDPE